MLSPSVTSLLPQRMESADAGRAASSRPTAADASSTAREASEAVAIGADIGQLIAFEAQPSQELVGSEVVGPDLDRHVLVGGIEVVGVEAGEPDVGLGHAANDAHRVRLAAKL